MPRFVTCAGIAALVLLAATEARAADSDPEPEDAVIRSIVSRPHTVAELEAGVIALPNAPISGRTQGGNTPLGTIGKGDATIQTGLHLLYRGGRDWAIGAGALFGPRPTNDKLDPGKSGLDRSHSRSYLFLGVEGRYVPLHYKWIEGWVGISAGGIVIADRFVTAGEALPPIFGTHEVTIRTEGFSLGVQAGLNWMLTTHWVVGLAARAHRWILPNNPQCSPIGDCASLSGTVEAFEAGLTIGYRVPL